ncbi:hypothetical protein SAICODRAFT_20570 [Saitoella complicata NRRL Y-17804]|uniref:uncharacterized protein n=1 Tax=Saitoella complicata (strain BCRC 22490 / CBS 7301 / JCM 7358 / NBRC 10748 / NRRL Y-17804) TaxID=698492 RepID=UPI0008673B9B|nr:uncharacterized protein SAICODRAFT_20570 [Saitoella complicata NRRL Y-17804]ODQ51552.1 hypothetical protein SAICODRAFT_20570 [Saitoella complicata NRRL Y-17804]
MYSSVSPIPSGYGPRYGAQPHFLKMTPEKFGRWAPSLVAWGATAGVAAIFLLSGLPRMKRDVLQKVPFVGGYFINEIPASDSPF